MNSQELLELLEASEIKIPKANFAFTSPSHRNEIYQVFKNEILEVLRDPRTIADVELTNNIPKIINIHEYHTNPQVIHENFTVFNIRNNIITLSTKMDLHFRLQNSILSVFIDNPLIINNVVNDVPHMINHPMFINTLKSYKEILTIPQEVQIAVDNFFLL